MDIVERIQDELKRLPDTLAQEVLDFIGYLEYRQGLLDLNRDLLKDAQMHSMRKVWDNPEDEVWNDL